MKQLDCVEKNVKTGSKMEFCKKVPIFWQNVLDLFLFCQFFNSFRKYVYLNYLSTKQLDFFEKM